MQEKPKRCELVSTRNPPEKKKIKNRLDIPTFSCSRAIQRTFHMFSKEGFSGFSHCRSLKRVRNVAGPPGSTSLTAVCRRLCPGAPLHPPALPTAAFAVHPHPSRTSARARQGSSHPTSTGPSSEGLRKSEGRGGNHVLLGLLPLP